MKAGINFKKSGQYIDVYRGCALIGTINDAGDFAAAPSQAFNADETAAILNVQNNFQLWYRSL